MLSQAVRSHNETHPLKSCTLYRDHKYDSIHMTDTNALTRLHRSNTLVGDYRLPLRMLSMFWCHSADKLLEQYRVHLLSGIWNNRRSIRLVFLAVKLRCRLFVRVSFRLFLSQCLPNRGTREWRVKRRPVDITSNTNTIRHFLLNPCTLHSH